MTKIKAQGARSADYGRKDAERRPQFDKNGKSWTQKTSEALSEVWQLRYLKIGAANRSLTRITAQGARSADLYGR